MKHLGKRETLTKKRLSFGRITKFAAKAEPLRRANVQVVIVKFDGEILTVVEDGFGVVKFSGPIHGVSHGVFTSKTMSVGSICSRLKQGTHVRGKVKLQKSGLHIVQKLELSAS